jgi:hypothetical protein
MTCLRSRLRSGAGALGAPCREDSCQSRSRRATRADDPALADDALKGYQPACGCVPDYRRRCCIASRRSCWALSRAPPDAHARPRAVLRDAHAGHLHTPPEAGRLAEAPAQPDHWQHPRPDLHSDRPDLRSDPGQLRVPRRGAARHAHHRSRTASDTSPGSRSTRTQPPIRPRLSEQTTVGTPTVIDPKTAKDAIKTIVGQGEGCRRAGSRSSRPSSPTQCSATSGQAALEPRRRRRCCLRSTSLARSETGRAPSARSRAPGNESRADPATGRWRQLTPTRRAR